MKIYYRGPATSFSYPLDSKGDKVVKFTRKQPGQKPEEVAHDVNQEKALDLITRSGHNFRTVDPEDMEKLFPSTKGEIPGTEGDDTPTPVSPSIETVKVSQKVATTLPSNSPAVRAPEKKV